MRTLAFILLLAVPLTGVAAESSVECDGAPTEERPSTWQEYGRERRSLEETAIYVALQKHQGSPRKCVWEPEKGIHLAFVFADGSRLQSGWVSASSGSDCSGYRHLVLSSVAFSESEAKDILLKLMRTATIFPSPEIRQSWLDPEGRVQVREYGDVYWTGRLHYQNGRVTYIEALDGFCTRD